jgi:hypothetical protein
LLLLRNVVQRHVTPFRVAAQRVHKSHFIPLCNVTLQFFWKIKKDELVELFETFPSSYSGQVCVTIDCCFFLSLSLSFSFSVVSLFVSSGASRNTLI